MEWKFDGKGNKEIGGIDCGCWEIGRRRHRRNGRKEEEKEEGEFFFCGEYPHFACWQELSIYLAG